MNIKWKLPNCQVAGCPAIIHTAYPVEWGSQDQALRHIGLCSFHQDEFDRAKALELAEKVRTWAVVQRPGRGEK